MDKRAITAIAIAALQLLSGLIVTRIILVYFGANGYLRFSEYNNYTSMILSLCGASFHSGVIQLISSKGSIQSRDVSLIHSSSILPYILGVFGFSIYICIFPSKIISNGILLYGIILIIPRLLVRHWEGINNGLENLRVILLSRVSLLASTLLMLALAVLTKESVFYYLLPFTFIVPLIILVNNHKSIFFSGIIRNTRDFVGLYRFASYSLITAVSTSVVAIYMRNILLASVSDVDASQWQGVFSISNYYLSLVSVPMAMVLLPKFSIDSQVKLDLNIILGVFLLALLPAGLILLFRDLLSKVLFDSQIELPFTLMLSYIGASFVRILQVVIVQVYLGQKKLFLPCASEIVFVLTLLILGYSSNTSIHTNFLLASCIGALVMLFGYVKRSD